MEVRVGRSPHGPGGFTLVLTLHPAVCPDLHSSCLHTCSPFPEQATPLHTPKAACVHLAPHPFSLLQALAGSTATPQP